MVDLEKLTPEQKSAADQLTDILWDELKSLSPKERDKRLKAARKTVSEAHAKRQGQFETEEILASVQGRKRTPQK